jgi:hypothetical protein
MGSSPCDALNFQKGNAPASISEAQPVSKNGLARPKVCSFALSCAQAPHFTFQKFAFPRNGAQQLFAQIKIAPDAISIHAIKAE